MWVGVEFYTILMKWCKNWCGLEMLLEMEIEEEDANLLNWDAMVREHIHD